MSRIFLASAVVIILSACTGPYGSFDLNKPVSLDMTPPPGAPEYEQGWIDGCNSALVPGNTHVTQFLETNEYKYDEKWRGNPVYKRVWSNAYFYCAYYMFSRLRYNT